MVSDMRRSSILLSVLMATSAAACGGASAHEGDTQAGAPAARDFLLTESALDFDETLARLKTAVVAGGFKIIAVVDHAAAAQGAGLPLRPTTLVIFGNPAGGTPLMQANQQAGFDLPLKALVYETEAGVVVIARANIRAVLARRAIPGEAERAAKIEDALSSIAAAAGAPAT